MAGMWAEPVATAESFVEDLAVLVNKYPELPSVVDEFKEALKNNLRITRIPLDDGDGNEEFPGVFAQLLDYPPLAAKGIKLFRVTYHAMAEEANPWQRFTLLSIAEQTP
jgi:hypothetical protein